MTKIPSSSTSTRKCNLLQINTGASILVPKTHLSQSNLGATSLCSYHHHQKHSSSQSTYEIKNLISKETKIIITIWETRPANTNPNPNLFLQYHQTQISKIQYDFILFISYIKGLNPKPNHVNNNQIWTSATYTTTATADLNLRCLHHHHYRKSEPPLLAIPSNHHWITYRPSSEFMTISGTNKRGADIYRRSRSRTITTWARRS